jgi:hypothetical protein
MFPFVHLHAHVFFPPYYVLLRFDPQGNMYCAEKMQKQRCSVCQEGLTAGSGANGLVEKSKPHFAL